MNVSRIITWVICLLLVIMLLTQNADCRQHHRKKKKRHPGGPQEHDSKTSVTKKAGRGHSKRHRQKANAATTTDSLSQTDFEINATLSPLPDNASSSPVTLVLIPETTTNSYVTNLTYSATTNSTACSNCVLASTMAGKVRGKIIEVLPGKWVNRFLGIQFGEPPIGPNRFREPKPVAKWKGVRSAFAYGNTCYQWRDLSFEHYKKGFKGTKMWNPNSPLSEDCLYLNVWAPSSATKRDAKLAVLVWIYGGGFYSGTSSLDVYDGRWLAATQNVVVVSINYRVAALGFLAAGRKDLPGNAGLFDQRLGLKWVRDNINNFGGDPEQVTVFGESSGAASISFHMMSPLSKGLFRNAVIQSASSLSPWSVLPLKEARRRASKLAKAIGCTFTKPKTRTRFKDLPAYKDINITCMQQYPAGKLVNIEMALEDYGTASFPNAVVVDDNFLLRTPQKLMQKGDFWGSDVNILAGFNSNEGNYFLVYGSRGFDLASGSKISAKEFKAGVRRALKNRMYFNSLFADNVMVSSAQYVYTNGVKPNKKAGPQSERIDEDWYPFDFPLRNPATKSQTKSDSKTFFRDLLDEMVGDFNFVCPTVGYLDRSFALHPPGDMSPQRLYLYNFVHRSSNNPWPEWMGVMHGYEIEFIFGLPLYDALNYTQLERNLSMKIMRQWGNFAKYGDPNGNDLRMESEWPLYTNRTKHVNVIGDPLNDTLQTKASLFSQRYALHLSRCSYWRDVFPELKANLEQMQQCPVRSSGSRRDSPGLATIVSSSMLLTFLAFLTSLSLAPAI